MPIEKIKIKGKTFKSLSAACRFYGTTKFRYDARVRSGWSKVKAITHDIIPKNIPKEGKIIKIDGKKFKSIAAAARFYKKKPSIVRFRLQKGYSPKISLTSTRLPFGNKGKTTEIIISEAVEKLKRLEKEENIKRIEDWYKIKLKRIYTLIQSLCRRKKITTLYVLNNIYPKKKFLSWEFAGKGKRVPKGTWKKKENRINYIKWLRKKLSIKKLSGFYSLKFKDYYKNNGFGLLSVINPDTKRAFIPLDLLKEAYPKYEWKFWLFSEAQQNIWDNKENHKIFIKWVLKKEGLSLFNKSIYKFHNKIIKKYKGGHIISLHYKSFVECLLELFPEANLDRFKFLNKGRGFWRNKKNHKIALLYLGKKLGFKKKNDWYGIQYNDFEKLGLVSLVNLREYNDSPALVVIKNLKEFKFDKTKFDFSSKYEFRARSFAKCLFGKSNIISNAKLNHLRYKKSGLKMELDIYIPKLKTAIEYNGRHHYEKVFQTQKQFQHRKNLDSEKSKRLKEENVNLIVIKYSEWDGFPSSFIKILKKKIVISKVQISLFWKRFKKDDLYAEVMKESKKDFNKWGSELSKL